jgi:hypothetical protein
MQQRSRTGVEVVQGAGSEVLQRWWRGGTVVVLRYRCVEVLIQSF